MTNETNQARTPAGVPTGGQFAASAKAESDVALGGNTRSDADAALIAEYLGDGPDLTANEQRLLDILVKDDVNSFVGAPARLDEVLDDLEAAGDDTSFRGAEMVAERLYADYEMDLSQSETGAGGFNFRLNRTDDGVGSYAVGAYLGNVENVWLSEAHDSKRLSVHRDFPEGTSGLRKAVAVAEVIDGDFRNLRAKGARLGLMPDVGEENITSPAASPATAAVWPQNDAERAAYRDYQHEVANGDAAESFRTWYDNLQAENAHDIETARAAVTPALTRVFEAEIANERHGGISPATIDSTIDSIHQGLPVEDADALLASLNTMRAAVGGDTPVEDLMD